jgi:hypothetical protein
MGLFIFVSVWRYRANIYLRKWQGPELEAQLAPTQLAAIRIWTMDRITRSIPELAGIPKDERIRLWRLNARKAFRHWQTWLAVIFVVVSI